MAELIEGYLSPANRFKWKKVAETLRDEYFGSACVPFSGGATATSGKGIAKGLKAFFSDQGYGMTTEYEKVDPADMAALLAVYALKSMRDAQWSSCTAQTPKATTATV